MTRARAAHPALPHTAQPPPQLPACGTLPYPAPPSHALHPPTRGRDLPVAERQARQQGAAVAGALPRARAGAQARRRLRRRQGGGSGGRGGSGSGGCQRLPGVSRRRARSLGHSLLRLNMRTAVELVRSAREPAGMGPSWSRPSAASSAAPSAAADEAAAAAAAAGTGCSSSAGPTPGPAAWLLLPPPAAATAAAAAASKAGKPPAGRLLVSIRAHLAARYER